MVTPLHVSHGAIIYEENCPKDVPEIDAIIWLPAPMPAIFEAGEFALVPRGSALGYLEVKRSNYRGSIAAVARSVAREDELVPVYDGERSYYEARRMAMPKRSLGVICLQKPRAPSHSLKDLIIQERAVVLLREKSNGVIEPDIRGMYDLINFLIGIRLRARHLDGLVTAKWQGENEDWGPSKELAALIEGSGANGRRKGHPSE